MDLRNPKRANSGPDGTFVDRNTTPGAERPGTVIDAETFNQMLIEFENVIKEDEQEPSSTDLSQFAKIIRFIKKSIQDIKDTLVKTIQNVIFPVGSYYVQYAGVGNTFQANESPAAMYGGSWSILWNGESNFFRTEGWLANEGRSNGVQQDASQLFSGEFSDYRFNDSYGRIATGILRLLRHQYVSGSPGNGYGNINTTVYRVSNDYQVRTSTETRSVNRLIRVYRRTELSS